MSFIGKYEAVIDNVSPLKFRGKVDRVVGILIESLGPQAEIGELCTFELAGGRKIFAEVVGFRGEKVQLMPFEDCTGLTPGTVVTATGAPFSVAVSDSMCGRVLDGMGRPLDTIGHLRAEALLPAHAPPPDVLKRKPIRERIHTGVKAIDGLTPVGKGQRMGIFSGSGVGKSTLLGMIARNTSADVNVVALIGERGREVREFIESDLGEEGAARTVMVVASSDSPPLARVKAAYTATTIAEYFRDQGKDVMFLFDSITRFARAQREIGLALGEPPATRGYTPSVFEKLPMLLERCGTSDTGTLTGFYTILVEGDDLDEPISDNVRGILDGHIVLSRRLAQAYHYPAVDILASLSRLEPKIATSEELEAATVIRGLLSAYAQTEDLISVGAYAAGSNPQVDQAINKKPDLDAFLKQGISDRFEYTEIQQLLGELSGIQFSRE